MRFIPTDAPSYAVISAKRVFLVGLDFLDAAPEISLGVSASEGARPWSATVALEFYFGGDQDPEVLSSTGKDFSFPLKDVTKEAFAGLACRVQDLFDPDDEAKGAWYDRVSDALTGRASVFLSEHDGEVRVQVVFHETYEIVNYVPLDTFKGNLIVRS